MTEPVEPGVKSRKAVSVCLFGNDKKYVEGATRLSKSVRNNLPGWNIYCFVGKSVSHQSRTQLENLGVRLIDVYETEDLSAMAWRFRIDRLESPDWVIFRDTDSIISKREAEAIETWVESGLAFHVIRDHPFHSVSILGGLWGIRFSESEWFLGELRKHKFDPRYGADQEFLSSRIYPKALNSLIVHASFHRHETAGATRKFRRGSDRFGKFCGESVTSPFLVRLNARLQRLLSSKECKCTEKLES
jgi:hypothetical protein